METKGMIKVINEVKQVSEKFKIREFVITTDGQYPQDISFQLAQDKCDLINDYKLGDQIEVAFNLRGREWINDSGTSKYFNTLDAWKISKIIEGAEVSNIGSQDDDDQLPF